jgi:uncharacterized protein
VTPDALSIAQARRIAVTAQGLGRPARVAQVTPRALQRVVDTVGVLQIDSVNVLARSHQLPVFSRLGPYPPSLLDRAAGRAPRTLVEYWAHEASFVSPQTHRLLRFRMARARDDAWDGMRSVAREQPALVDAVRSAVAEHGPLTAAEVERRLTGPVDPAARDRSSWGWNWSDTKRAIEYLFWAGVLSSAGRTSQFERRYDLPERVLPAQVVATPDPEPAQAWRELVAIAARAHGVATEPDLRDYFRLRPEQSRPAVAELVEAGELAPVAVEGWTRPAYLHRDAVVPGRVSGSALLSPFDSLVWFRDRTHALFGFRYRLEIYTPAQRRVHGYYVLPYLVGDRLVARVDLKADRPGRPGATGRLLVQSAWAEPLRPRDRLTTMDVAERLAADLARMAGWLGLDAVQVNLRGDLSPALSVAVADALGN